MMIQRSRTMLVTSALVSSLVLGISLVTVQGVTAAEVAATGKASEPRIKEIGGLVGQVIEPNFTGGNNGREKKLVARTLVWRWTAPGAGAYAFVTHGSEMDTVLTVSRDGKGGRTKIARNDDDGDLPTSSVEVDVQQGDVLIVEVAAKADEPGLVTLGWSPSPKLDGERSRLQSLTFPSSVYQTIPISTNTGEKPQSKVWQKDGVWWVVLASTQVTPTGTWLWRQEGSGWRNVLHLSSSTASRADVKVAGDITHILLHGPSSELVSVEYVGGDVGYEPWTQRPSPTPISLPGTETATIDIDGAGRMWLGSADPPAVQVRYSDPPYTAFSGPIELASGIKPDDIAMVTVIAGGVGVLWSDQNARRFGFRTHNDDAPVSAWTQNEVPAGQSAISLGNGMADDHMNAALASDGTLYAAVKTSYDTAQLPKVSLLIRRPNGVWDRLYEVDRNGTRPIVLLNEQERTISIVYTETEELNDIIGKTTSMDDINFSGEPEIVLEGKYNNVTSTKQNWTDEAVVFAASATQAVHAVIRPAQAPGIPTASDGSVQVSAGDSVTGQLQATGGQSLTYEVVNQPAHGQVVVNQATGSFVYTAAADALGSDEFTFRAANGQVWSQPARVSVFITPSSGPVGNWTMDDGTGTTAADSSGLDQHGSLVGSPQWVTGVHGSALQLTGADYVTVPDSPALDLTTRMTVAAWVRPQVAATQYVVKKASQGGAGGYELGLSSNRQPFLRFNQSTSGDTYRVNATSQHPINGQTWVHLAGTYDGTTMRIYVNGVEQASKPGPATITTNTLNLAIGAEPNGFRPLTGAIDDVVIHATALSATQIAQLAATPPPPVRPPTASDGSVQVAAGDSVTGQLQATGGQSLTYEVVNQPAHGQVVVNQATGSFVYTAAADALGSDEFTFRAANGQVWSQPARVSVFITPSSGPVGNWTMDDGTGTTAADSSGLDQHGSLVGSPQWVTGVHGSALQLTGADYVTVPDSPALDLTTRMTVAAWVRPQVAATQYVVKKASQGGAGGYELGLSSNRQPFLRFNQSTSGDTYRVNATSQHPINGQTWVHLAGTYDGTTMRIYVNGVEQASKPGPATITTNTLNLAIGAEPNGFRPLTGAIDDVVIHATALSATQIAQLAATPPPPVRPPTASDGSVQVAAGDSVTGQLQATGGQSLTYEVVNQPAHGQVVVNQATGSFVYTAAADALGSDEFTFRAANGQVWSQPARVSVFITPSSGPVGNWTMDDGTGTTAADSSGLDQHGSLVGSPQWVTGVHGSALQLTGADYVTVPDSPALDLTTRMTVAAWVRPQVAATQYVVKKASQGGAGGYELGLSSNRQPFLRFNQSTSGDTYRVNATSQHPINGQTWVHLAGTYDGTTMRIYVNGVEQASKPGPATITTNTLNLAIGAEPNGFRPLTGAIDDVVIHATALSATQIAQLAATPPPAAP